MIIAIVIISSLFVYLLYELKDWLRYGLVIGDSKPHQQETSCDWLLGIWYNTFKEFIGDWQLRESLTTHEDYPYNGKKHKTGYKILAQFNKPSPSYYNYTDNIHTILVSPGIKNVLCGKKWLREHWRDCEDYEPKVELYFGNGYRQTFTLRKPELMQKIIKINTGKKYFKALAQS